MSEIPAPAPEPPLSLLAARVVDAIEDDLIDDSPRITTKIRRPNASTVTFMDAITGERWLIEIRREGGSTPDGRGETSASAAATTNTQPKAKGQP